MDTLIQGTEITKRYDGFTLDAFNITVAPDRIVGLIGSNGAGKTTLLKTLLGMTTPDAGTIRLLGADPHASGALDAIKQRIGVVLDTCAFPVTMKVRDVETLGRAAYEKWNSAQFTELCATFGLAPKKLVKDLSRGMGMKLSLAFALSHYPDLLILDEATAGLDPIAREEVLDIIRAFMAEEGHGVLMATHITTDLEKVADEVICIDDDTLVFALAKEAIADALPAGTVDAGLTLAEFNASIIIGIAVATQLIILIAATFTLPLIMRFGMTKGSRIVPVVLVCGLSAGAAFFGSSVDPLALSSLVNDPNTQALVLTVANVITLVLYGASALLSARLYETREL